MTEFKLQRVKASKLPKVRGGPKRVPKNVRTAADEYCDVMKKRYGVRPTWTYDHEKRYIYIGNSAGVGLQRLKSLTTQAKQMANPYD